MQHLSSLFLLASVLVTPLAAAQMPPAAPTPCATPAHRQFDFWIGEWEVSKSDGTPAGRSRIESILEACVISENWTDARLHLQGGLEGERMVLAGTRETTDPQTGPAQRERISWTPNADGSVRQLWETSKDDGRTWITSFDGLYRRAGN